MATNVSIQLIPIGKLHFDPHNPRLPDSIERGSEDTVLDWMLRNGSLLELMSSIGTTGYSDAEPVLAVPCVGREDCFEVVEGNRRLAAVKLLSQPTLARVRKGAVSEIAAAALHRPTEIPVLVYKAREEILAYLGYRHITGVKSWGSLEKAKYLKQLFDYYAVKIPVVESRFKAIASTVATKPSYAKKTLATLALIERAVEAAFWGCDELDEGSIDFAVLGTALSYKQIAEFVGLDNPSAWQLEGLDESKAAELIKWLFLRDAQGKTRVGESRNLGRLARVLEVPQALSAFRTGRPLEEAALLTPESDDNFRLFMRKAHDALKEAESHSKKMQQPTQDDVEEAYDIRETATAIHLLLKDKHDRQAVKE